MRHDSSVATKRPHTRDFPEPARKDLALAVIRAREAVGYRYRTDFARAAGLGVRSTAMLEQGDPVGPAVYEAAGRALGRMLGGWSEATPLAILHGQPAPPNIHLDPVPVPHEPTPKPEPQRHPDLEEFLGGVIEYLRKQGISHEAIMRAVADIVETDTERETAATLRSEDGSNG